jgi:membrane protease YdiL (CAAX protease family)
VNNHGGEELPTRSFDPEHADFRQADISAAQPGTPEFSMPVYPCPWGPWATIGWTFLCVMVMAVLQIAAFIVVLAARMAANQAVRFEELSANGDVLAWGTLASTPAVVGLVVCIVHLRRYPVRDYLALSRPEAKAGLISLAGLAVLLGASDFTSYLLGRPIVPPVMVEVYRTGWLPGLLVTLVLLAPLEEETLFRGFLYKGIAASRAGPVVAIIASAVTWALLHVQYDWYGIVSVAAMGVYLGVVRCKAGSVLLTILLHAIANGFATLEMVVSEHWLK